jgi:hypothetical protein
MIQMPIRRRMKQKIDIRETEDFDDLSDESDHYSGDRFNAPKRSPMRRKEKFRTMDFKEKKHKNHKRSNRNKTKYEFDF